MATRFYLPNTGTSPLPSLARAGGWEGAVGSFFRAPLGTAKTNTTLGNQTGSFLTTADRQDCVAQWVSGPMQANLFSNADTVSMVVRVSEADALTDAHLAYTIRVVSNDGSVERGVVAAHMTTSTEFPITDANAATRIHNARAFTGGNIQGQDGDRLVIELGAHGVSPAGYTFRLQWGDPSATADFALTVDLVTQLCPWVEISPTLVFYTPGTVTTAAASAITQTTASSGGNVTSAGNGACSARGVCWNTTGSPTIADSKTTDGSGVGAFTSALTGLYPSFRYYCRAYATTEYGTVYGSGITIDTLPSASRSLVARPFTTRAAAAESVARSGDAIIDWWIEWRDSAEVACAEIRPTDSADIPRHRWYVVSRDTAGATVDVQWRTEDTPDFICVLFKAYGVTGVRDGTMRRVYYPAAPTSAIERVQLVNLSDQYMSDADATQHATNVYLRASEDAMAAKIAVKGGLYTVDGHFRPAPLILAGDWIDVIDEPGHVPTYITGDTHSRADWSVTITTGGREQSELIIPGMSALPAALTVFGEKPGAELGAGPGGGGDDDGYDPEPIIPSGYPNDWIVPLPGGGWGVVIPAPWVPGLGD